MSSSIPPSSNPLHQIDSKCVRTLQPLPHIYCYISNAFPQGGESPILEMWNADSSVIYFFHYFATLGF